jgi:hypothetical protein
MNEANAIKGGSPSPEAGCKHPEGYTAMGTTTGRMYCAYCREPEPTNDEKCRHERCVKGWHKWYSAVPYWYCEYCDSKLRQEPKPDSPSPEARVDWENKARDIAIWQTGGISGFADDREIVLDAWTVQIADALQAAFEKGREAR